MEFQKYDEGGIFNDQASVIKVAGPSNSSSIVRRQREIGLIDKIEEILSDLPIPSNHHRNFVLRGVNASKYFDDFLAEDFEGHVLKVFQLIRLMKWLNFIEDPLQDWFSIRQSTISFFVDQKIFSNETITA